MQQQQQQFPIVLRREFVRYNPKTPTFGWSTETVHCQEVTDGIKKYLLTSDGRVPIVEARTGEWSTAEIPDSRAMWMKLCSPRNVVNLFPQSTFPNTTFDQFANPQQFTVEFVKVGTPFKIIHDGVDGEVVCNEDDDLPNVASLQF